jgi:hypothetical protein
MRKHTKNTTKTKFAVPCWLTKGILSFALLAQASASAVEIVWTNTAGGNWGTAANWNPNQLPGNADNAFITNGGTYTVTVNVNATVASLQVGGSTGTQTLALPLQHAHVEWAKSPGTQYRADAKRRHAGRFRGCDSDGHADVVGGGNEREREDDHWWHRHIEPQHQHP